MKRALRDVLIIGIAGIAFLLTRIALIEMSYAKMNYIEDKEEWELIQREGLEKAKDMGKVTLGSENAAEILYIPPVFVLRIISLGYQTALHDLLFVRAHAYFLSHFFSDRLYRWLDEYYNAIVALDPDNPKVYLWSAQVMKYGQIIDDEVVKKSNKFLMQGLERFPDAWPLHLELGFNLYFELRGESEQERAINKMIGREHFAKAASYPESGIDPNFVMELFERTREDRLALSHALERYYDATDEQRREIVKRIGFISKELAEQVKEEESRWKEEFPFIPIGVYSLLGRKARLDQALFDYATSMGNKK